MDPNLVTQLLEAVGPLIRVEVMGALTVAPMVLQWAKMIPWFTGQKAAILSPVVAALVVAVARVPDCSWACLAFQGLLAWVWIELVYTKVVEPMARSKNPLFPNK